MPPVAETAYWRSLDELAETPEFRRFVEAEFPSRTGELVDPLSRRRFLQVMGASLAMAGLTGCDDLIRVRWPKEEILPFASRPEGRHPGTPVYYASAMELAGVGVGVLVKSFDGRPIKVEGNPEHPDSQGATDAFTQASLLDLYDPDRARGVFEKPGELMAQKDGRRVPNSSWAKFGRELQGALAEHEVTKGEDLLVISEASSSLTQAALKRRLEQKYPKLTWVEWEPLGRDNEWDGGELAFGQGRRLRSHLHLAQARVILSLDSDFLHAHPHAVRHARDFMNGRRATDISPDELRQRMNRLYVVESVLSLTGAQADHRLAVASTQVPALAAKLAQLLLVPGTGTLRPEEQIQADLAQLDPFLRQAAQDLLDHRGQGLVVVGARQPKEVHALGHLLNQALENVGKGKTLTYTDAPGDRPSFISAVERFTAALKNSQVGTVLILGGNPVVDVPRELGFGEGLQKAKRSIYLGTHLNETALRCTWALPRAHWLESWGDTRGWDGTLSLVQPLISPIWEGRSAIELLSLFLGQPKSGYDLVRATLQAELKPADFERAWRRWLHDGVIGETRLATRTTAVQAEPVWEAVRALGEAAPAAPGAEAMELVLTQDASLYDGRFANNAWLQELPDPVTKLTWDNALLLSPAAAEARRLHTGDMARIEVPGSEPMDVAVMVLPGMAEWTAALSMGYPGQGRTGPGAVAKGTGFDAYPLRTKGAMYVRTGVKVGRSPAGGSHKLAVTQDHHTIVSRVGQDEVQRRITGEAVGGGSSWWLVREGTVQRYAEEPGFARGYHGPDPQENQLWQPPIDYAAQYFRWGMAIDLNACTGCSTCVVACQAENNIPVVGKSEVERGREMHWLRIDRYFRGDPRGRSSEGEELAVMFQPVPCMQCENAPCESVCPVAATTHSVEGLNDMAYNRCIGTRYCSNNCPYKVRRFNWFWNHHGPFHPRSNPGASQLPQPPELTPQLEPVEQMAMNPDVTVRSRGVMEKCTYCVQRIKAVSIPAKNQLDKRLSGAPPLRVPDGAIQTACQQACPTGAIVFGDLNDPNSRVSQLTKHQRAYSMLAELNTRPRTRYLAKLRNPRTTQHSK